MDPIIILQAGVASGTVLLFATLGEVFAERSGVLNLGVEGMMLIGAMTGFSVTIATGNPWLGVLAAMLFAGLISQIHAFITIAPPAGTTHRPAAPAPAPAPATPATTGTSYSSNAAIRAAAVANATLGTYYESPLPPAPPVSTIGQPSNVRIKHTRPGGAA